MRQKCFIDVALSLFSHIVKLWPSRILMFVFSMPKNLAQVGTLCKTLELFTLIVSIPRQTLPMLIQHCLRPSTTIVNTSNHCVIGSPIIGNDINHRLGTLTIFVDYQNHYYNHCQLLPLVQDIKEPFTRCFSSLFRIYTRVVEVGIDAGQTQSRLKVDHGTERRRGIFENARRCEVRPRGYLQSSSFRAP